MKEISKIIKKMDKGFLNLKMALNIKVDLMMINLKDKARLII